MRLGQARHAIHAVGQALAVPVHAGVLGQAVSHKNAHPVALDNLNSGAGALPVVAPHVDHKARRNFAYHGLGHQMELFDASVHAPGRGPAIKRDDGLVRATVGRN